MGKRRIGENPEDEQTRRHNENRPRQEELRKKRDVKYAKTESRKEWEECIKKAREKYESSDLETPAMMISTDDEIQQKRGLRFLRETYAKRKNRHTSHKHHFNITSKERAQDGTTQFV